MYLRDGTWYGALDVSEHPAPGLFNGASSHIYRLRSEMGMLESELTSADQLLVYDDIEMNIRCCKIFEHPTDTSYAEEIRCGTLAKLASHLSKSRMISSAALQPQGLVGEAPSVSEAGLEPPSRSESEVADVVGSQVTGTERC